MTRLIAWTLAALVLTLPAAAHADQAHDAEEAVIGAEHARQHVKIRKAQTRAIRRWRTMTRAERRRARKRARKTRMRTYLRAQAAATGPASEGSWDPPFVMTSNYEGYAIHAAMLHTGKVLMWGYPIHTEMEAFRGNESFAWLWDPSLGTGTSSIKEVEPIGNDGQNVSIYCSGMSFLPDGRVLVVGGNLAWPDEDPDDEWTEFVGLDKALLFDPVTETWTELPRPGEEGGSDGVYNGRWYPTQTLLPDGRTFVISGLDDEPPGGATNEMLELYEPPSDAHPLGRFTLLDSAAQRRRTELYPHVFVMPDGDLLLAGPNPGDSAIFDPDNLADPWTDLPPLASQRIGSTAVVMPEDTQGSSRVAVIGGRPYGALPPSYDELIDLDDPAPAWEPITALNTPRSYPNTVLLPDESMVTVGGDSRIAEEDWPPPEFAAELYDPVTGTWRVGPKQTEMRAYHSTALLLPDGRVLSTGDDFSPTSNGERSGSSPDDTGEIYSPPYLFDAAGDRIPAADRPLIEDVPAAMRWDVPFAVDTPDDIDKAVLVAPSAVTHANDMNQRLVPLRIVDEYPSHGVTLQSPPLANVAPPGYYMLFLLADGVPSVAAWVRLDGSASDVPAIPSGAEPDTTPPDTSITKGPTGTVASDSASFEFTSTEPASSFACRLDAGAWASCTSPRDYASLADGSHTFEVRATDPAGNVDASAAARTWSVDTTPPETGITAGPSGTVATSSASFEFSSPDPDASFECRLDSGAWAACTSPRDYASLPDGSHTFEVRAEDPAGNTDASPESRTWTIDTTAPGTSITSGPSGTVASATASFDFSATEAGSSFECRIDAGAWASCTSPHAYSSLGDGSHTFEVRAADAAGNQDTSPAARTWTVDTTPPETELDLGPSGPVASSSASFAFSSDDWAASFECKLDSGEWEPCTSPQEYTELTDGDHTFQVRAKDGAGNEDATPASRTWTVDTTAPDTSITAGPGAIVASDSASFEFLSEDTSASFECRLDTGTWSACTSPHEYTSLAEGSHTFEVRAEDPAGNVDPSPASATWRVDPTAPAAFIESGPSGTVASDSATFSFDSADEAASFECQLDSPDWELFCTSPRTYDSLPEGEHTFRVRAKDSDGNVYGEPDWQTWTVDTVAPDTSITAGPSGTVASSSASFGFSSGDAGAAFECRLDFGEEDDWSPCAAPKAYSGLADGSHTFEVRARDAAGNEDASPPSRTWTVDTTPPETAITTGPAGTTGSGSASFAFFSPDANASFECRLDSGEWETCTSPKDYSNLSNGGHTFSVRARDPAGNADPSPAAQTWTVDTTPPDTSITGGPSGTVASTSATFEFASSDGSGTTFECRLDSEPWSSCTSPRALGSLSDGSHRFSVRGIDAVGNVDASPASRTWTVDTTPDPDPDPDPDPEPEPDPPTDADIDEPDDDVADFAGPVLRLKFAERRWLRRLRHKGRLRVKVRVDEPAKVALKLYRGKKRIGRKRAKIRRRGGTRKLTLRPRRRALRWLRRSASPQPRFVVVARDAAKNDTRWGRVLTPALRR